jgi:hypothetical protein
VKSPYPVTPDGRYFVARGRLWRCTNPFLPPETKEYLIKELMQARRAKGKALRKVDEAGREAARQRVDEANHKLGERAAVVDGWNPGLEPFHGDEYTLCGLVHPFTWLVIIR